jgi:hypothetical protein
MQSMDSPLPIHGKSSAMDISRLISQILIGAHGSNSDMSYWITRLGGPLNMKAADAIFRFGWAFTHGFPES